MLQGEIRCQFCNTKLAEEPADFEDKEECLNCGAKYWIEDADDLYLINYEAAEMFEVGFDQIETKVLRNYDIMLAYEGQPADEGTEACLVFVRKK